MVKNIEGEKGNGTYSSRVTILQAGSILIFYTRSLVHPIHIITVLNCALCIRVGRQYIIGLRLTS
jgi:hypothetical protein